MPFPLIAPSSVRTSLPKAAELASGIWLFTAPLGEGLPERAVLQRAEKLLSSIEVAKADSFAFPTLRDNYVFSHAFLRLLLAEFISNRPPEAICFRYNAYGKPYLADEYSGLQFSMSHSNTSVLVALARADALGADIEPFSSERDNVGVAEMCFSHAELADLQVASCPDRLFYHIWTRKEAWLKAVGTGLVDDLDALEVISDEPIYRQKPTGYSCVSLALVPDHAVALSFAGLQSTPIFHASAAVNLQDLL